jgi:hypothetical protein
MAITRPKLIGGARAVYSEQDAGQQVKDSSQTDDCSL